MRSLLFQGDTVLSEPVTCGPKRREAKVTLYKYGRKYVAVLRDKVSTEDPYIVLVKATAFAVQEGEPFMGRVIPRNLKDFLIKTSVVI
jgi:hypothetical protein